jgi:class 3 adenylate cyclase
MPMGIVTFLFTDIEGSTRLWEEQPNAMREVLACHDALLHTAIESNKGHVFKTVGDAFFAAFACASNAVQGALDAQSTLRKQIPEVRVRMALHTGEAEVRAGDYFGPALNRVARLLSAGHGGQILLSEATAEQIRSRLPADTWLRSLGAHRLRDIVATETIHQLQSPGLPTEFPQLNTLDVAFRRGATRAAGVSLVVIAVVASLAFVAVAQARHADRQARIAAARSERIRSLTASLQVTLEERDQAILMMFSEEEIRIAHSILQQAIKDGASEIQVEPRAGDVAIHFTTSSATHQVMSLPKAVEEKLVARYKIMAEMNIAEKGNPQDGRIVIDHGGQRYYVRVHSQPAQAGEKITMEISTAQ